MKTTERLNYIYENFNEHFVNVLPQSFHNCLWQIMINEFYNNKIKCFSAQITDGNICLALVVANESGFIPMAYFKSNDIKFCSSLAYQLGVKVLDIPEQEAERIISSSIFCNA